MFCVGLQYSVFFAQYSIQYLGSPVLSIQYSTQYSTVSSTGKLGKYNDNHGEVLIAMLKYWSIICLTDADELI